MPGVCKTGPGPEPTSVNVPLSLTFFPPFVFRNLCPYLFYFVLFASLCVALGFLEGLSLLIYSSVGFTLSLLHTNSFIASLFT